MKIKYDVVKYCFKSGDTLEAVIRRMNHHDLGRDLLDKLVKEFRILNNVDVPRLGQPVLIPVFPGFVGINPSVKTFQIEVEFDGNNISKVE